MASADVVSVQRIVLISADIVHKGQGQVLVASPAALLVARGLKIPHRNPARHARLARGAMGSVQMQTDTTKTQAGVLDVHTFCDGSIWIDTQHVRNIHLYITT